MKNNFKTKIDKNIVTFYEKELGQVGQPNEKGWYKALCPFHDDTKPSLSINLIHGGYRCYGCGESGNIVQFYMKSHNLDKETAIKDLFQKYSIEPKRKSLPKKTEIKKILVETYDYLDINGTPKFQTCRYEPKSFNARRSDGKDGWIYDLKGVGLFPFNLPQVMKAETVYICEGERDCITLKKLGLTASCNPFGAGKWRPEFNQFFQNKNIVIIPDNDAPGRKHSQNVAESLNGPAKSIKILELPGLPEKNDVSDWIYSGGTRIKLVTLAKKTQEWIPSEYEPENEAEIRKINEEYAVVMIGGKCRILKEIFDPIFDRPDVAFLSIPDFKNYFANKKVPNPNEGRGQPKNISISKVWLESPLRKEYKGIIFNPGKDIPDYYNLWKGLAVEPQKGTWSFFREHIYRVVSNRNKVIGDWILAWMARIVQDPGGERPGKAIVLKGGQGTGKGLFAREFGKIFGSHFLHISHQNRITGNFNYHLKNALLVFGDEVLWGGDKKSGGPLKSLVTEPSIVVEPKGLESFQIKNHINLILASNNEWVIPADIDDRRFLVLEVSEKEKQNRKYFDRIYKQMDNGGREAMLYDLLKSDNSDVDLRKAPKTKALFEQKLQSMTPVQQFWYERLREGTSISNQRNWFKPNRFEYDSDPQALINCKYADPNLIKKYQSKWCDMIVTEILYEEYKQFIKSVGKRDYMSSNHFTRKLRKICPNIPESMPKRKKSDGSIVRVLRIPLLEECRRQFETIARCEIDWG